MSFSTSPSLFNLPVVFAFAFLVAFALDVVAFVACGGPAMAPRPPVAFALVAFAAFLVLVFLVAFAFLVLVTFALVDVVAFACGGPAMVPRPPVAFVVDLDDVVALLDQTFACGGPAMAPRPPGPRP